METLEHNQNRRKPKEFVFILIKWSHMLSKAKSRKFESKVFQK